MATGLVKRPACDDLINVVSIFCSITNFSEEWFKNATMEHPLKMLALKSIPSLNSGVIESVLTVFPHLRFLDLAADLVPETRPITNALEKKPEMVVAVNDCIYFRSTLKAVTWFQLRDKFNMTEKCFKSFISVSHHASGVSLLSTFSPF